MLWGKGDKYYRRQEDLSEHGCCPGITWYTLGLRIGVWEVLVRHIGESLWGRRIAETHRVIGQAAG